MLETTYLTNILKKMRYETPQWIFISEIFFSNLVHWNVISKQNNSETNIWLPGSCFLCWTTCTIFTVVLRLSCPFIRLTNLSKTFRSVSVMSETLTEVIACARTPLGPVNHCKIKKKKCLLGTKGWGHMCVLPHKICLLASLVTMAQFWAILSLLQHLHISGYIWCCNFRILILLNVLAVKMKVDQPEFLMYEPNAWIHILTQKSEKQTHL